MNIHGLYVQHALICFSSFFCHTFSDAGGYAIASGRKGSNSACWLWMSWAPCTLWISKWETWTTDARSETGILWFGSMVSLLCACGKSCQKSHPQSPKLSAWRVATPCLVPKKLGIFFQRPSTSSFRATWPFLQSSHLWGVEFDNVEVVLVNSRFFPELPLKGDCVKVYVLYIFSPKRHDLSDEKNPGCWGDIGDCTAYYVRIITKLYMDPY